MPKPSMTWSERVERFWSRVRKTRGCWRWTGAKNGPGYGKVYDGRKVEMAHRFAYRCEKGRIPRGKFLCHKCDNPICVRPDHLFVGTARDNAKDCYAKKRSSLNRINDRGVGTPVKLKPRDVRAIRKELALGKSQQSIADRRGINQTLVSAIKRGVVWKHVV